MRSACFLDTNIILYAAAGRIDFPTKYSVATGILGNEDLCLSGQVLAEFAYNAAKKFSGVMSGMEIDRWLERLSIFPCVNVDADLVRHGVMISRRYQISYWDGALVAAAERLDAPTLYTEDLSHGQLYGSVRAINPFTPA
jgi:predicted nucleic acid-binding protein